jgi:hypothetical protein
MARYDYIVDVNNTSVFDGEKDKILKNYLKYCKFVELMSIKHEFSKITKTMFIQDIFYGYDYSTSYSYTIQQLNPEFCRVSGLADGVRTFEFDFSYFNGKRKELLDTDYGEEFTRRYEEYQKDAKNMRWQELSPDRSVCLKLSEETDTIIPIFASIFPDIFDLQDYKLLKKASTELQNYVVLVAKIPYHTNSDMANDFALMLDDAIEFGNKAIDQLPSECGFILSPYEDVTAVHLGKKDQSANTSVAEAEKSFWDATGVNQAIFNSDKISEESIRKSIISDETIIFSLYRQYERWLNRKIKLSLNDDFKAKILNTTEYNYGEVFKRLKEGAMYGMPMIREMCASLGMSPLEMQGSIFLENDILKFSDTLTPVSSSNTMSPDKAVGRPQNEVE